MKSSLACIEVFLLYDEINQWKRVEAGEIAKLFLRGVNRVFLVGPVQSVGFCGEPVEIVADKFPARIVELELQEIGGGEIVGFGKVQGFGGGVGVDIDGGIPGCGFFRVDSDEFGADFQAL